MEHLKLLHGSRSSFLKTVGLGIRAFLIMMIIVGGTRLALISFGTLEESSHTAAFQFFSCMGLFALSVVNRAIGFVSERKVWLIIHTFGMNANLKNNFQRNQLRLTFWPRFYRFRNYHRNQLQKKTSRGIGTGFLHRISMRVLLA